MAKLRPFEMSAEFADAYHQAAIQGASMRLAANALETIREALDGSLPHIQARSIIDDQVGRADLKRLAPALVRLRKHIFNMLDDSEVKRLQRVYARDVNEGWQAWLLAYTQAFSDGEWYLPFCRKIAREALVWVPESAPSANKIRHDTDCASYGRWPEVYDWFIFLSQQALPPEQRRNMLAIAAEIQIYHYYQPSQGRALIEGLKDSEPGYRIDQVWGEYYLQVKEPEKARPYFEGIISKKPDNYTGYVYLGDYFIETGDLRLAEEQYEQAIENAPGVTNGYQALAVLLGKVDWYTDREARLQTCLERMQALSDNPAEAFATIGDVYRSRGEYEKAVQYFKHSLTANREAVNTYSLLGHLDLEQAQRVEEEQERQKLIAQARQTFNKLLKLAPRSFSGYWGMMTAAMQEKNLDEALEWLKKARRCHPQWASYINAAQGDLLQRQGKRAEARRALTKSLKREPVNPYALPTLLSLSDDYYPEDANTALQLLDLWRQYAGESEEYNYQNRVGNVWYYHADYVQAAAHYRLAISSNPKNAVVASNLALALEQIKAPGNRLMELDEAIQSLGRAIKLNPVENEYTNRQQKLMIERDFIAACGEDALRFEPVVTPVRLAGQADLIALLLTDSREALTDETQQQFRAIRLRIQERLGVQSPEVLVSHLEGKDIPAGKFVISIREQSLQEGVLDLEQNPKDMLFEHFERILESNMALFTGYQQAHDLLAGGTGEACQALLTSPGLVTRFMLVLQTLLHKMQPVREIDQIAARVLEMSQAGESVEQAASGIIQARLAESEVRNGK